MSNPVSWGCAAIAIVVLGVGGAGCTTVHPLVYANTRDLVTEIKPHTRLRIITVDGKKYHLLVTNVADVAISGTKWGPARDTRVKIPLNNVREIDLITPAPGKTGAIVGGVIFGYLFLQALAVAALASLL